MPNNLNQNILSNAGTAHSQGIELETTYSMTDQLTIRIGATLGEAEIGVLLPPYLKGDALPSVPDWTLTFGLDYDFSISDQLSGRFHFDHQRVYAQLATRDSNAVAGAAFNVPPRNTTNLRLNVYNPSQSWRVTLFARNLTNEDAVNGKFWAIC